MRIWIIIGILVSIFSCTETVTNTVEVPVKVEEDPVLKLEIDWQQLGGIQQSTELTALQTQEPEATHFGARLVYPQENAVFIQSAEQIGPEGIITMEVPVTKEAKLYVVAVRYEEGNHELLQMGVQEDLILGEGEEVIIQTEEYQWFPAEWRAKEEEDRRGVTEAEEAVELSFNQNVYKFEFEVLNPFDRGATQYSEHLIRLNGTGGVGAYEEGYKTYFTVAERPDGALEKTHSFFPFLSAQEFNLPEARYVVGQPGELEIRWVEEE